MFQNASGEYKKMDNREKLKQERETLDQMIENALIRGIKIADDEEIQKQSLVVERLIEDVEAGK